MMSNMEKKDNLWYAQEAKSEKQEEAGETPSYRECVSYFAENCDCNGIPNIQRSEHVFRRFCWTVLVLAGAVGTIYQVVGVFITYFSYPVSINVNVTFTSSLAFPAITICNVNMIRRSKLSLMNGSPAMDLLTYSVKGNKDISGFATTTGRAELRRSFINFWSRLNPSIQKAQGHQLSEMLLDCSYNGQVCNTENFTAFISPMYGNCFTYNSDWTGAEVQDSHKPGPFYGLMLELFIEQDEYVPELTEAAGVIVTIHSQDVMPFPEEDGIQLPPDTQTNIAINVEDIERLESPYPSKCLNVTRKEAEFYSAYSQLYPVRYTHTACQRTCYQAHLFKECSCGDPTIPMSADALYNLMTNKSVNITSCQTASEISCEAGVHQDFVDNILECNCTVACNDKNFQHTSATLVWPNDAYKDIFYGHLATRNPHLATVMNSRAENGTNPGDHLVKLMVYFEEFNYIEISESPSYPRSSLLSDLGGSIGFYLGISVIATFEFIEFFIDLIILACRKRKIRNRSKVQVLKEKAGTS